MGVFEEHRNRIIGLKKKNLSTATWQRCVGLLIELQDADGMFEMAEPELEPKMETPKNEEHSSATEESGSECFRMGASRSGPSRRCKAPPPADPFDGEANSEDWLLTLT